jgi:hypothetical protein
MDCHNENIKNEEANDIIISYISLVCEEQHMHKERVWSIRNGLVHHSLAAGPAARYIEL